MPILGMYFRMIPQLCFFNATRDEQNAAFSRSGGSQLSYHQMTAIHGRQRNISSSFPCTAAHAQSLIMHCDMGWTTVTHMHVHQIFSMQRTPENTSPTKRHTLHCLRAALPQGCALPPQRKGARRFVRLVAGIVRTAIPTFGQSPALPSSC
jgi:hypothetical protein